MSDGAERFHMTLLAGDDLEMRSTIHVVNLTIDEAFAAAFAAGQADKEREINEAMVDVTYAEYVTPDSGEYEPSREFWVVEDTYGATRQGKDCRPFTEALLPASKSIDQEGGTDNA